MGSDIVGNRFDVENDGRNIFSLHDDDQLTGLRAAIFNIGYKKLLGKPWTDSDRLLLDQVEDNRLIDLQPSLARHIAYILKGTLCHDDVYRLKLSLSGIVNTICSSDFDHVRPFLRTQYLNERLDDVAAQFRSHATTNDTKALLQQVIDTL
ncbi:hypothetical protein BX666DRAFT_1066650 [Dichotomocladium elegans]|nr:hypothetical protein BX666DRAFT_1066650 [Dichotomocladium elegans]